jgi:integrase
VSGRPGQKAKALVLEGLERIVAYLVTLEELTARRDSALLQVAYFGAFRRSELVTLELQNVQWEREGLRITLPRSKTDQEGEGLERAIP